MKKLLFTLLLVVAFAFQANSQIVVTHFNAEWNAPNKAEWVDNLHLH